MSYQVIARKWRPQAFQDIIGQSHINQTLLNAIKNNRLPHALLFTGPRGTGKTSTARVFAKVLRCPNVKNFEPCHKCAECEDIALGRSVNVIEIDGASNNGVDAIRELRETVGYMPSFGKYKIYIIDEVHMLSTSAFNALLKTLEEPPEHVIFIMATTEVHKIPNTILSRCQRFDFRRISFRTITDHLQKICKAEKIEVDPDALWVLARQGEGSLRDSQSLLDQVITFSNGKITLEKVVDVLGLTDRALLLEVVEALVARDVARIVEQIEKIFTAGYDPKVFMQDLLEDIRNLLLVKLTPEKTSSVVDLPDAEIDRLRKVATALSEEDIHLLFDMALKGGNDIPKAQDPQVVMEMVLLRMAAAPRIQNIAQLLSSAVQVTPAPTAASSVAKSTPAPRTSAVATPTPTPTPTTPTDHTPQAKWAELVQRIKAINGLVAAKLEHSYVISWQDKNITIGVPPKMKFLFDQVKDPDFMKKLTNYVVTFWGSGFNLKIELGAADTPAPSLTPKALEEKTAQDKQAKVRQDVENHPLVKSAQSVFSKSQIKSIKEEGRSHATPNKQENR